MTDNQVTSSTCELFRGEDVSRFKLIDAIRSGPHAHQLHVMGTLNGEPFSTLIVEIKAVSPDERQALVTYINNTYLELARAKTIPVPIPTSYGSGEA